MKLTIHQCDICGKRIENGKVLEGVIREGKTERRFDICPEDAKKLFGKIAPKPRRGRKPVVA